MGQSTACVIHIMSIQKRLIDLRREKQLTQQEMADRVGLHVNQIRRYEAGATQPSLDALKRIAVAMSVTIDWLVFDEGERGPNDKLKLHFEAVSQLEPDEQRTIMEIIDGMLLKHDAKRYLNRASNS